MAEDKKPQMNIEVPDNVHETYANLAVINHSPTEFVVDCIQMMPGMPKAKVKSRVILNPLHAKQLLAALAENVKRYEETFGEITQPNVAKPTSNNGDALHLFGAKGEA
ncbi:hypothetical protein UJ101_01706 [Flavobacteriaceae bacterium UJ101]|nr:hypothetical protein UJ101_01706 [Flavobacteriaceae bacterium UJ101]